MKEQKIYFRIVFLGIAICMMIAGIFRGEMLPVYVKAINICLECIGLG